jgi:hypothetical protein
LSQAGKKEKDPTAGVDIAVLYEELVRNGIVKRVPEVRGRFHLDSPECINMAYHPADKHE